MTSDPYAKLHYNSFFPKFGSTQITTSEHLTILTEDWSGVRSPSRAERRRKQGHRQNIRTVVTPDPSIYTTPGGGMICHPATLARLSAEIAATAREKMDRAFLNAMYGNFRP
ncbi:MAG: hypothetical protein AAFY03_00055 [Pseudomonadota bacterium]